MGYQRMGKNHNKINKIWMIPGKNFLTLFILLLSISSNNTQFLPVTAFQPIMNGVQNDFSPIEVGTLVLFHRLSNLNVIGMVILQDQSTGGCTITTAAETNSVCS